jgi:PKHD-type hydroxylase
MVITIPDLLDTRQLEAVCSVLRQGEFVDGRHSAGKRAAGAKNNLELAPDRETYSALNDVVMSQLVRHPLYLQTALPAKIAAPIYARYLPGMEYGGHIDDPVMGPAEARYRCDLSITVFLNSPGEYEGGELRIQTESGIREIKLDAGHAVIYPAGTWHSVNPVTSGERLVALTWVQSLVRRADQREVLVQLDRIRENLSADSDSALLQQVDLCYASLFRMWAEV